MEMIADILLAAGAIGAGFYCHVLARRLKRFNSLEQGVGGAVAMLSAQVDDLTKTLAVAQKTAGESAKSLIDLSERAEAISRKLELQMASLHDVQSPVEEPKQPEPKVESQEVVAEAEAPVKESNGAQPMFMRHTPSQGVSQ